MLKEGDRIVIKVRLMNESEFINGSYVYSMFQLFNTAWKRLSFMNVTVSPKLDKLVDETFETVLAFPRTSLNYTVTLTLSKSEALELMANGLIFNGYGLKIKGVFAEVDGTEYSYDDDATTLEEQYASTAEYRNAVIDYYSKYMNYTVPFVYITTENHEEVVEKSYYESIVDVANCDSECLLPEDIQDRKAGVKVRGNASAWTDDKPYRIKFSKKQNMLGLHGGKKYKSWVLLKTGWSFGADYLAFKLAEEIYRTSPFDYYVSDCAYVHVFVNESYKGMYLLCEQSQAASGRIDIDQNKKKSTDIRTGYLVELDNYAWEDVPESAEGDRPRIESGKWKKGKPWKGKEDYHFDLDYKQDGQPVTLTDINGFTAQLGDNTVEKDGVKIVYQNDSFTIKTDIYSDEQAAFIANYVAGAWDICYNAIEKGVFLKFDSDYSLVDASGDFKTPREACEQVIDLESLCNVMILEELIRNYDVGAGSLYMAIDFTVGKGQKYEKLTFECPWDSSWAYTPIENDPDAGKYWKNKKQYFAGAWQNPMINTAEIDKGEIYERSHPWFILFNNADWFRGMLREKWERIGPGNLRKVTAAVIADTKTAVSEQSMGEMNRFVLFIDKRTYYINNNLWK